MQYKALLILPSEEHSAECSSEIGSFMLSHNANRRLVI